MMLNIWTLLWLLVCLTIVILILESIYRRIKERQLAQQELDLQRQIQQQYSIYTLQPSAGSLQSSSMSTVLSQQQQQYIQQQQELKAFNDLPPKYEDVVKDLILKDSTYTPPISCGNSSSTSVQRTTLMTTSDNSNTNHTIRY